MGIKLNGVEHKGAQYADEFWLTLIATRVNIENAMAEFQAFYRFSGLQTNFNKTVVLPIGALANRGVKINVDYPLHWIDQPIKILGIFVHTDPEMYAELNYSPLLKKIREIITMWHYRSLTILGKIQVINSLVASQFTYRFSTLPSPPANFFNDYKALITEFIWDRKRPKVAYEKLIQDYPQGGVKLVDLKCKDMALKAGWVYRAMQHPQLPIHYNLPIKDEHIWKCNMYQMDYFFKQWDRNNSLACQVWQAWSMLNFIQPVSPIDILDQTIWYNHFIKKQGLRIFWQTWAGYSGIHQIRDIYDFPPRTILVFGRIST